MPPGVQPFRSGRRSRRPRGATRFINRWRIAGLALLIGSAAVIGWLVTSEQFVVDESRVEMSGLGFTSESLVRSTTSLDPADRPNVFLVPTQQFERALAALPHVADAEVSAVLPDRLLIEITERSPVLIIRRPTGDYSVDADGVVLQRVPRSSSSGGELPLLEDERIELGQELEVGGQIDATDVAAMLRLLALTPAALGSQASTLSLTADDEDGYVVVAQPFGWRAVFGHYTPSLRPPEIIGDQVECLRSVLGRGESTIDTIYLAPNDDRCGTYLPRSTSSPSPSASARMTQATTAARRIGGEWALCAQPAPRGAPAEENA